MNAIHLPAKRFVHVGLAVNHPNSGTFTGNCERLTLSYANDLLLDIESLFVPTPVSFRNDDTVMEVATVAYDIRSRDQWVGNWCWDEVVMTIAEAAALLANLRMKGWSLVEGEIALADAWESGDGLTAKLLGALLIVEEST